MMTPKPKYRLKAHKDYDYTDGVKELELQVGSDSLWIKTCDQGSWHRDEVAMRLSVDEAAHIRDFLNEVLEVIPRTGDSTMTEVAHLLIREDTMDSIKEYVLIGRPPGDFLRAVMENDLQESFGHADQGNRATLFEIVSFVYTCCPNACHGNPEAVRNWVKLRGLQQYPKLGWDFETGHAVSKTEAEPKAGGPGD